MHQVSKILFCQENLHVSGIFCAHHQELSAVHGVLDMFHAGYVDRQRPNNLHETYQLPRVQLITPVTHATHQPLHTPQAEIFMHHTTTILTRCFN
jgi:hypothetical protein